jgi:polysaccharide export outer membrane protein
MALSDPVASGIAGRRCSVRPAARARRLATVAGGLLLGLLLASAPGSAQSGQSYQLGPKDVLEIKVFEAPELSGELRVSDAGTVALPARGGEVAVAGLTELEAAAQIERALEACCVNRATVTLTLKEIRYRPISVIGAVARPGPLGFAGRWTLLEVLTAAGGVTTARGDVVHILRRGRSGLSDQLTVRIDDLLLHGNPRANIPIYAADLVNVPPAVEVTVYCLGEVQRPGPIVFKSTERMSLLTALARAGGLTERASKKIEIKRESADGKVAQLEVDYKAVLAGKLPDPLLQAGDLLLVKESFF